MSSYLLYSFVAFYFFCLVQLFLYLVFCIILICLRRFAYSKHTMIIAMNLESRSDELHQSFSRNTHQSRCQLKHKKGSCNSFASLSILASLSLSSSQYSRQSAKGSLTVLVCLTKCSHCLLNFQCYVNLCQTLIYH